ncbi:MAG: FMN-binding protein [Clostridia bacterium]|nr:FMN-binding protein [Clostridia bacterium]
MIKKIVIPAVSLFVICLVCTLLLAFVNQKTAPKIEELAIQTETESRAKVLSSASTFEEGKKDGVSFVTGYNDAKEVQGYIFVTTTKSYGGDLQVMTGVDAEGKVTGIEILEISDTAGLGMKATTQEFKDRFVGLVNGIIVDKNTGDPEKNQVQALTGATITSNAVAKAVNEALAGYETVTGNGGAN